MVINVTLYIYMHHYVHCHSPTQLIRTLLEDLPRMFADNKSVHSALGPALQAATKLLVRLRLPVWQDY